MYFEIRDFTGMRAALKALSEFLRQQNIGEETVFAGKLVSSELLSNVLQHSSGFAYFMGGIRDGFLEIEVNSDERFTPPEHSVCSAADAECGRGLFLVDAYCERRIRTEDGGIKVFIRLETKDEP